MRIFLLLSVGLMCLWVGCKDDVSGPDSANDQEIQILAYLDSMGVSDQAEVDTSGLYRYPIVSNPLGKTQLQGNVLTIHYSLKALGADQPIDVYDSADGTGLMMKQGAKAIYPVGIDYALAYLKEGEEWEFVLPSRIAYGDFAYPPLFTRNAVIVARLKLLKIQTEQEIFDQEAVEINQYITDAELRDTVKNPLNLPQPMGNGIVYKRIAAGDSGIHPLSDQNVTITYTGQFLDNMEFARVTNAAPFEFVFNSGSIILGLDFGVGLMELNERALIIMPSNRAYAESAVVLPEYLTPAMVQRKIIPKYAESVGPYQPLVFDIRLISIN